MIDPRIEAMMRIDEEIRMTLKYQPAIDELDEKLERGGDDKEI